MTWTYIDGNSRGVGSALVRQYYRRFWERLKPLLPGGESRKGCPTHGSRRLSDAICWFQRADAPWWDTPPDYGARKNTHRPVS